MPGDVIADGVAQFVIRWLSGYGRLRSQRGMPWHRGIPLKYATDIYIYIYNVDIILCRIFFI